MRIGIMATALSRGKVQTKREKMKQPELGWTTPVQIKRVIDGDTVKIVISREVDVRLTDEEGTFDAPETYRPSSKAEELEGIKYTLKLKDILETADEIVLFIPTDERGRVKDIFSIGSRVVGHLFADGVDVVEELKKLEEKNE